MTRLRAIDVDSNQRKWSRYTFNRNQFSSSVHHTDPEDLTTLYVNNKTDCVQRGVPFDLKFRDWGDNELKVLRWYTHGKIYSADRTSRKAVTLLADKHKGMLFHCPLRRVFDWKEKMDYSYYDVPPSTNNRKDKKKKKKKKGNVLSRPENKSILHSDSSGSSSDEGIDPFLSERKKELKKKLLAMSEKEEFQGQGPQREGLGGKGARVHKTQAMEEHRTLSIWVDLGMTKPGLNLGKTGGGRALGVLSASTLQEESESTSSSVRNPGTDPPQLTMKPWQWILKDCFSHFTFPPSLLP